MGSVEVRLVKSVSTIESGQPVMRHGRFFTNAVSGHVLALLLGLKFCGAGGSMVDSTAELEEDSENGRTRFIKKFRPLGAQFPSVLAGCFNVHQELMECERGPKGMAATIKMTFSNSNEKDREPSGSFLWLIEPTQHRGQQGALWTELINCRETVSCQLPELRIGRGKKWIFRLGHNHLIGKAALRIAEVLISGDHPNLEFAKYAAADRLNFKPK